MEVIAEVEPTRSPAKLEALARAASRADWADVPDAPMGVARASSIVVSCVLQCRHGVRAIPHVRVVDRNRIALEGLIGSLGVAGFSRVVFLRGDKPPGPGYLEEYTPEEAARLVRERYRGGVEAGLILSMRRPPREAAARLAAADFFLVTNAERYPGRFREVAAAAAEAGVRLYPYVVVETPGNRGLLRSLGLETPWRLGRLREAVEAYWGLASGLLVSAPGDPGGLAAAVEEVRDHAGRGGRAP